MNRYDKLNNLTGWVIFLIASIVYIITSEPTASFWDCGEYIATAYKLQVGHPPGAPLFQVIGRFFALFAFGDTMLVARMINTMSALSSSFTILFLFWTITMLARKLFHSGGELKQQNMLLILGSGVVGALTYTFTDSFWFSAVEGEVYAMSSFFTAVVFWAILKWERAADKPHADRWLILIAYLIGLSIGVHLLNLLAIPAITFVYYYKKYDKVNFKGVALVMALSLILLTVVMYGIIPETVSLFASAELLFVNTIGMPFHIGTVFFALVLIALLATGLRYTRRQDDRLLKAIYVLGAITALLFLYESSSFASLLLRVIYVGLVYWLFYYFRKRRHIQNTILLSLIFLLIGYASFMMLIIRSNADPPINENTPKDAPSLLTYLNREQYGEWPLLYGQYYNAPVLERLEANPMYVRDEAKDKYVNIKEGVKTEPVYDPEYMTLFPRMWNNQDPNYAVQYKNWAGIKRDPDNKRIPTFGQNLRYFFSYQLGYMYFRYFMWNFTGRQNEIQGRGTLVNGNWISGINFIDEWRLGQQDPLPSNMESKSRNGYYFLPLALGLAGFFFHYRRSRKDWWVVMLLFIMTGVAIVVYLNQHAWQPRERDYAYAASFYAFSIWIGLGLLSLANLLGRFMKVRIAAIVSFIICLLAVPLNMAIENWDDHDRSGRYHAVEMAKNYLESCAPNAILFTNGDNDTFPLWYAQEVEGFRTDVRVCNLSLLNADWYIDQMRRKVYDSDPLPISLEWDQYKSGTRDVIYFVEQENIKDYLDLPLLFNIMHKDPNKFKLRSGGQEYDFFPSKKFRIPVDSALVVENGTVPSHLADRIEPVEWKVNNFGIQKNHLIVFDILAHNQWNRPIYFSTTTGDDAYIGLEGYFTQEGMAYRLIPVKANPPDDQIADVNTGVMFENLMNKMELDMRDPDVLISEDSYRSSMNMRNNYGRLAQALIREGREDSAIMVCNKAVEMMPDEVVPFDFFLIPIADAYFAAGATEKGVRISETLYDYAEENLVYFFGFSGKKAEEIDRYQQQYMAYLQEIMKLAEKHGRQDLFKRSKALFDEYYQIYVKGIT